VCVWLVAGALMWQCVGWCGWRAGGGGNNRVYVHNLAFEVSWQDLKDHMKAAGPVTRADIILRPDGTSKVRPCCT
jgi:hypothetical protein